MDGRWVRRALVALVVCGWAAQAVAAWVNPRGDFRLHYLFGRRLQAGEFLYEGGLHAPYPPAWAVPHAPLSLLPEGPAKTLVHVVGGVSLILLIRILADLSGAALPLPPGRHFWACAAALAAAHFFVIRDFADGGQNLILLTLAWGGVWGFARGRPLLGGASLGLAIALKCTAGVFVGYFLLKGRWRPALASLAWAGLLSLSPLLWQTPAEFRRAVGSWADTVKRGLSQPDPSVGVIGPEKLQNWALRNAMARYLMHLPPAHPGRAYLNAAYDGDPAAEPNPRSVDLIDLPPATAGLVIKVVMGLGMLVVVWLLRGRPAGGGDGLRELWELATVGVLALLYSPITWGQHCVAALPAVYLMARAVVAGRLDVRRTGRFLTGFGFLFLLVDRVVVGKPTALLIESYHAQTAALCSLVVALFLTRPARAAVGSSEVRPRPSGEVVRRAA